MGSRVCGQKVVIGYMMSGSGDVKELDGKSKGGSAPAELYQETKIVIAYQRRWLVRLRRASFHDVGLVFVPSSGQSKSCTKTKQNVRPKCATEC
jgi:hypothetical protein